MIPQQASENKQEMEVLKGKLAEETVKLEQRKKHIDIELADIQPLVDEAKKAVGNIKSESLSEIRYVTMVTPHDSHHG